MSVRLIPFVFLASWLVSAQEFQAVTVGVKGGVPVTQSFTSGAGFSFDTKRYTVGPTVEFHLPAGLGVEVDALYKRLSYSMNEPSFTPLVTTTTTANSWEFPVLLKLRPFADRPVHPFITPGASFRHVSGLKQIQQFFGGTSRRVETDRPFALQNTFTAGVAIGGGIEFRPSQYFRLSPEFRYTWWGWENFRDPGGAFRSGQNQAEFLLGVTF